MRAAVLVLLAAGAGACDRGPPPNAARAVSDRFMDAYFVEIDQQKALSFTTGEARRRLEEELAAVSAVREGQAGRESGTRVFWRLVSFQEEPGAGRARAIYDVTIRHGRDEDRRHALVSLHNQDGGAWRVAFFAVKDGAAPRAVN